MSAEHIEEEPPIVAEAGRPTSTTLAIAPEQQTSTTIVLEKQRIVLQQYEQRRDLHDPATKAFQALDAKCGVLRQKYEVDLHAHRGKLLLLPKVREAALLKRKATMAKKEQDMVARIVAAVEDVVAVRDKGKLTAAVTAALTTAAPPPARKKKRSKATKAHVEVMEESD